MTIEGYMTAYTDYIRNPKEYCVPRLNSDETREMVLSFADSFAYYHDISIEDALDLFERADIPFFVSLHGPYMGHGSELDLVEDLRGLIGRKGIQVPPYRSPI